MAKAHTRSRSQVEILVAVGCFSFCAVGLLLPSLCLATAGGRFFLVVRCLSAITIGGDSDGDVIFSVVVIRVVITVGLMTSLVVIV